jgi:hypothetical protein
LDGPELRRTPTGIAARQHRDKSWGWPGVTPAAISTDTTAGAPSRPWLTSAKLHSSNASPRCLLGPCQGGDNGASRTFRRTNRTGRLSPCMSQMCQERNHVEPVIWKLGGYTPSQLWWSDATLRGAPTDRSALSALTIRSIRSAGNARGLRFSAQPVYSVVKASAVYRPSQAHICAYRRAR